MSVSQFLSRKERRAARRRAKAAARRASRSPQSRIQTPPAPGADPTPDAEQALLGEMLADPVRIPAFRAAGLQPEGFRYGENSAVCDTIYRLHDLGQAVTPLSAVQNLPHLRDLPNTVVGTLLFELQEAAKRWQKPEGEGPDEEEVPAEPEPESEDPDLKPEVPPPSPSHASSPQSPVLGIAETTLADLRCRAKESGVIVEALPFLGSREPALFAAGASHILAANAKSGKTTLLFALAKEWATEGKRVLLFSEEPEAAVWRPRIQPDETPEEVLRRITLICCLGLQPEALLRRLKEGTEDIAILDTSKVLSVRDEDDAALVNRAVTPWVVASRETKKTLIVLHHTTKGGGKQVEAVAGSHAWGAVFDTVLEIHPYGDENQRLLRAVGRLLPSCKVLYEARDGKLVNLGEPGEVEIEGVRERILHSLDQEWRTTSQVRSMLPGEPKPSLSQVLIALRSLAQDEQIERYPSLEEGARQGVAFRWRMFDSD